MTKRTPPDASCTLPAGSSAPTETLDCEICVVGGGMAGLCAALASARMGRKTILVQDRAVLGGNASSEVRMWICGAHGPFNKETGYLEEIQLANMARNPRMNYAVWDSVLYGIARNQENLTLILSCAITDVAISNDTEIRAVTGWHLTRQKWIRMSAKAFIDCSGDSILRLSGAPCRWGREAQSATGEKQAQPVADRKTMGNTILIQLREIDPEDHQPFVPPSWALPVDEQTFPQRSRNMKPTGHNFWWLEIGGTEDTMEDADSLRERLMAIAYGVWNFIKNHPDARGHRWELEWIGALPGKRENIRYEGDHILTQEDIEARGQFPDIIAHGGWTMDDHPPAGIHHQGQDTTHYPAPSPYGIPYRCLYSHKVRNLWFAGRNISATHMAMSSTRVMATCATVGQAAGTAAAIAVANDVDNRGVYTGHIEQLQRRLLDHDQWLPGRLRPIPPLSQPSKARYLASVGDPDILRDGHDRPTYEVSHRWDAKAGDWVAIEWDEPVAVSRMRLIGDSQLHRVKKMPCNYPRKGHNRCLPPTLPRDLILEARNERGEWERVSSIKNNEKRCLLWNLTQPVTTTSVRLTLERGWGDSPDQRISLFSLEVGEPEWFGPIESTAFPEAYDWKNKDHTASA